MKFAVEALQPRGPDQQQLVSFNKHLFGHTRLCIRGSKTTPQPFMTENSILLCNGEIYNADAFTTEEDVAANSDCIAILRLFEKQIKRKGHEWLNADEIRYLVAQLDGIFSFVYWNKASEQCIAARSLCGVMPLYLGFHNENMIFASERKAFFTNRHATDTVLFEFPPEHILTFDMRFFPDYTQGKQAFRFHRYNWVLTNRTPKMLPFECSHMLTLLQTAVNERIKTVDHGKIGFLLSGGLDSSLLVAIARQLYPNMHIRTFSIGLSPENGQSESPDLLAARVVAKHLSTDHHEYTYTMQEGIQAIPDVIRAIESLDTTSVRASTPNFLLNKKIKEAFPDMKVIISGEGSDELFRGYLCFHHAPSLEESTKYSIQLMNNLYRFDVRRCHQTAAVHGMEVRVPFLSKQVVDYVMRVHPVYLTPICESEKYFLRKTVEHLLPHEIVWRTKDQFSDAVGYQWIDMLRTGEFRVLRSSLDTLCRHNEPTGGKEQLAYWDIFIEVLGEYMFNQLQREFTQSTWMPAFTQSKDPSGRVSSVHSTPLLDR